MFTLIDVLLLIFANWIEPFRQQINLFFFQSAKYASFSDSHTIQRDKSPYKKQFTLGHICVCTDFFFIYTDFKNMYTDYGQFAEHPL